jgi:hypothetical protein
MSQAAYLVSMPVAFPPTVTKKNVWRWRGQSSLLPQRHSSRLLQNEMKEVLCRKHLDLQWLLCSAGLQTFPSLPLFSPGLPYGSSVFVVTASLRKTSIVRPTSDLTPQQEHKSCSKIIGQPCQY